jgi:hypothetical protein
MTGMSDSAQPQSRLQPSLSGVCAHCRHWVGEPGQRSCAAFDCIPMAIWLSKDDHARPWPGDGGIRFQPIARAVGCSG